MRNISHQLSGRLKVIVQDHEGNTILEGPWQSNLLLNQGMDNIATILISDLFDYAAKGTDTTTLTKIVGSVNVSQSANVVTAASGTPFSAGLVGQYIIGGAAGAIVGNITGFTDSTHITIDGPSQTVANGTYNIWAVNQTGLVAENGPRTNTYSSVAGDNKTTTSGNVRTLQRAFIFAPETANTTYQEIGFSNLGTAGANLNIRVHLASGVAVLGPVGSTPGQNLKVIYEMTITVTPDTPTVNNLDSVIADSGNAMSANKNASFCIETFATSTVGAAGQTVTNLIDLEPSYAGSMALSTDNSALVFASNNQRLANNFSEPLSLSGSYTPGSFTQNFIGTFDVNSANMTGFRSLMLYNTASQNAILTYLFTTAQTKDASHSLTITWSKSWGRTLS